jgi:hypothetical protein
LKQTQAEFDIFSLFQKKSRDILEFIGPIEIQKSSFGYGMFATRDIK